MAEAKGKQDTKGKGLPCCPKCGNNEFVIQLPRGKKIGLWGGLALGAGAAIAIYAYAVGKEEAAETTITILQNAFDPDRGGEMAKAVGALFTAVGGGMLLGNKAGDCLDDAFPIYKCRKCDETFSPFDKVRDSGTEEATN